MTLNKETIKQLAQEEVERIKKSSDGIECFGRFFTWEELEKAMIEFFENKLSAMKYPDDFNEWCWDDLPFEVTEENRKKLWELLSPDAQSLAFQFGCSDTEFRDKVFEETVKTVLHFSSCGEYYRSCTFDDYLKKGATISID